MYEERVGRMNGERGKGCMKSGREGMYEEWEGRDVSREGRKGCIKRGRERLYEEREVRYV
jgi:hypothetical protein